METATVGVRLKGDVWARYSAEAQALGVSMGTYLRRRLEEQDRVAASLDALRVAVERTALIEADEPLLQLRQDGVCGVGAVTRPRFGKRPMRRFDLDS